LKCLEDRFVHFEAFFLFIKRLKLADLIQTAYLEEVIREFLDKLDLMCDIVLQAADIAELAFNFLVGGRQQQVR
jgi:hypothetical protein